MASTSKVSAKRSSRVAIAALMASPLAPLETVARVAALLILWAAMGMTLVSGFQYVWATRQVWDEE